MAVERFGPFLLLARLGQGGMGEVHLARSPWPKHPLVAVKRLHATGAATERFLERFEHEAQLAVRLRHPHIVSALHVGSVDGRPYVASELVTGTDALTISRKLADTDQGIPIGIAVWILDEMLQALAYVHGAMDEHGQPLNLIHRDVTPSNILLDFEGHAKLADFGLAKSTLTEGKSLTDVNTLMGTPAFMPPEVLTQSNASQALDTYGIGAVVYTLLTGLPPYWGTVEQVFAGLEHGTPVDLRNLRPDLPWWLIDTVNGLMHRDPKQRPDPERLHGPFIHQAKEANMMTPRFIVRRWLQNLFKEAYQKQAAGLAEAHRVPWNETPGNNTVVFAQSDRAAALKSVVLTSPDSTASMDLTVDEFDTEDTYCTEAMITATVQLPAQVRQEMNAFEAPGANGADSGESSSLPSVQNPASISLDEAWGDPVSDPAEVWIDPRLGGLDHDDGPTLAGEEHTVSLVSAVKTADLPRVPAAPQDAFGPAETLTDQPQTRKFPKAGWFGIALGLGISIMVAWLAFFAVNPSPPSKQTLKVRYLRVHEALQTRASSGQNIPDEAWVRTSKIANALVRQDYQTAEVQLVKLENELQLSRTAPPTPP